MAKVAFGLVRVSTAEQSMESQKESLRKIAKDFGFTISDKDFYAEQITGYDEDDEYDRDSIKELEEQIALRKPSAIFVLELSRLSRRAIKVSRYIDRLSITPKIPMYFVDYELWTIDIKTGKPIDDNIMTLYGGAKGVEIERERIKSRTKRGRDAKAEKGYYVGHLTDGYLWEYQDGEKVIIIDEERRSVIEKIFDLYGNKGYTSAEVMEYLNAKDIPTTNKYRLEHPTFFKGYKETYIDRSKNIKSRKDLLWNDGLVCCILRDTWYIGKRKYNGVEYSVPRIIDDELWDKVQKHLAEAKTITAIETHPMYLLSGLLYCGKCGRKLYAHADGYNNMYYCSSQDYGRTARCGLRWIRQENLDSIVLNIIKERTYGDTQYGQKTILSDFFSVDKGKLNAISEQIRLHKDSIKRRQMEINRLKNDIQFVIAQQVKYRDNEPLIQQYEIQLDRIQNNIDEKQKEIEQHEIKLNSLSNQKVRMKSTKKKLENIANLDDFKTAREFVHSVIKRIVLYNPDDRNTIIQIEYIHDKVDCAIYSPTRLKKRFILFSTSEISEYNQLRYDGKDSFIYPNHYILLRDNHEEYVDFNERFEVEGENRSIDAKEYVDIVRDEFSVFCEKVSVKDYVEIKRTSDYLFSFKDILPLSEKGEIRKAKLKEWYKQKYNTGKPTFTPFVVKDATYEQIQKERKHLYNRKYKILKNKSLTEEQKAEKLFRIDEQLDAFKYQLKYLPTNKKGVMNIEKYNKEG